MIYLIKNQFLGNGGGIPIEKLNPPKVETTEERLVKIREELKEVISTKGKEGALDFLLMLSEVGHIADKHLDRFFETYF